MAKKVTKAQAEKVERIVRKHYGAESGLVLVMDWDWPSSGPTPTLIWEGGPHDWAIEMSELLHDSEDCPLFVEPYSGWALCLYPPESGAGN